MFSAVSVLAALRAHVFLVKRFGSCRPATMTLFGVVCCLSESSWQGGLWLAVVFCGGQRANLAPHEGCRFSSTWEQKSINHQSWGAYARGRVASPTLRRHSWRSGLASLHAGSLPIPINSQQEALTCRSQEFCVHYLSFVLFI